MTDWLSVSPGFLLWVGVLLFLARLAYVNYRRFRHAAEIEDLKQAVAILARLRAEGVQIYARPVTPEGLEAWYVDHRAWRERVLDALRLHHHESTVLSFESLGVIADAVFVQGIGQKHNHQLTMLAKRLEILEELIDEIRRSIPVGSLVSASISSASSSRLAD